MAKNIIVCGGTSRLWIEALPSLELRRNFHFHYFGRHKPPTFRNVDTFTKCDFSQRDITASLEKAESQFTSSTHLVLMHGVDNYSTFHDNNEIISRAVFDINFFSTISIIDFFAKAPSVNSAPKKIVFISSSVVENFEEKSALYAASKAACETYLNSLYMDWSGSGVLEIEIIRLPSLGWSMSNSVSAASGEEATNSPHEPQSNSNMDGIITHFMRSLHSQPVKTSCQTISIF